MTAQETVTSGPGGTPAKGARYVRSAYILTAIALAWMGGLMLLHVSYVRPNLKRQAQKIETDTAREWLRLANDHLRIRRTHMLRMASNWTGTGGLHEFFRSRQEPQLLANLPAESVSRNRIGQVLVCDDRQQLLSAWKSGPNNELVPDPSWPPGSDLSSKEFFQLSSYASETSGIDSTSSPAGPTLFARSAARDRQSKTLLGYIVLLRPLDSLLYGELSAMVGANVSLRGQLPAQAEPGAEMGQVIWRGDRYGLNAAQVFRDSAGKPLGYLTVKGETESTYRQVQAVEQAMLGTMLWATAFALIMVLVIHALVSGPTARLLSRVQRLRKGQEVPSLSADLRGEALALGRQFEEVLGKVEKLSQTDSLTALRNRRSFQQVLQAEFRRCRRYNRVMTLMMLDLDFLKAANDALGHQAGDQVITAFAQIISDGVRSTDTVGRLGGDEFAVLMPESSSADALVVGERIRQELAGRRVGRGELQMTLTASVGIADVNDPAADSPETLVDQADKALYAAKRGGRNRCVRSDQMPDPSSLENTHDHNRVDNLCKQLAGLDAKFKRLFVDAIGGLISALEARDEHTANHSAKVRRYATSIARKMALPERTVEHVGRAAMLHDIGKIGLPDSVLRKASSLTKEEWELVRRHPIMSVRIVEGMEFLDQEIPAVRYHHEQFDGSGYPEGLAGSAIPLGARILAVADSFDAMVSSRVYRDGMGVDAALEEIRIHSGTQFDPAVVEAFFQVVQEEKINDQTVAASTPPTKLSA